MKRPFGHKPGKRVLQVVARLFLKNTIEVPGQVYPLPCQNLVQERGAALSKCDIGEPRVLLPDLTLILVENGGCSTKNGTVSALSAGGMKEPTDWLLLA